MKKLAFLAALLLAGCATTDSLNYRPANYAGPAWVIDGKKTGGTVEITINGKPAAKGDVSLLSGEGTIKGEYEGKPVRAECSTSAWSGAVKCIVLVAGEEAGKLNFDF